MIDDNREVLAAIKGLEATVTAKHDHLADSIKEMRKDSERHGDQIGKLYDFDRDRRDEISDLDKKAQPAITHAKDSKKMKVAGVLAAVAVLATAFADNMVALFKSNGG